MNRVRGRRLVLAGLATLLAFILLEFVVESLIFRPLFGQVLQEWHQTLSLDRWGFGNVALNLLVALINCTLLTWLYVALRPMFGVGPRTALIASAFAFLFVTAFGINSANLGAYPLRVAIIELGYQLLELPGALVIGARVYEGSAT